MTSLVYCRQLVGEPPVQEPLASEDWDPGAREQWQEAGGREGRAEVVGVMEPRHKDVAQTETRHRHEQTVLDPVVDIRGKIAKDILKIDELETNITEP